MRNKIQPRAMKVDFPPNWTNERTFENPLRVHFFFERRRAKSKRLTLRIADDNGVVAAPDVLEFSQSERGASRSATSDIRFSVEKNR